MTAAAADAAKSAGRSDRPGGFDDAVSTEHRKR
jgi:hypothetical protein